MYKIKKTAKEFLKEVNCLTINNIETFINNRNFVVRYFSPNDKNVSRICTDALQEKGFVYRSDVLKLVYISIEMSVREKIETLIHEVGHILLDKDTDTTELKGAKAVMFADYVLNHLSRKKAGATV